MIALNAWLHAVVLYDHVVHLDNPQVPGDAWTGRTALQGAIRAINTDVSIGTRIGRGRYPGLHSYFEILLPGHGAQLRAMMEDDSLTISPPIYMAGMKIVCWKCAERMPVVAFLAPVVEGVEQEVCVLTDILALPEEVRTYVQKRVPTFQLRYSKTVEGKYYANTCPSCGIISGDFFLHSEPGAPFFPTCEREAGLLYLTEIPMRAPVRIKAGYHVGTGELILNHAKRIA